MKRKKIMPMLLSFIMLAGSAFTAHADNQTLTEDGSVNVPLTAVIESKYSVSIPASLTMTARTPDADGTPFTGTVAVGVKGNINPGKAVVVLPMQGTVEEGSLTAASIAAGNTLVDGVTTEELNSLSGSFNECNIEKVKDWYDGYLFGEAEVYNPWSLMKYVKDHEGAPERFPEPYWANTSSNSIIKELIEDADEEMREELDQLIGGGTIEKRIHEDITYGDIHDESVKRLA